MKSSCIVFALLVSTLAGVQAQVTGTGASATAKQSALPAPTAYQIVSRSANEQTWERTVYERGPDGSVVSRKSRYKELCSGLNFFDSISQQWRPSREEIALLPPGGAFAAAAINGQHRAFFPLDIAQGVVQVTTGSGEALQSRPVGLFFEDDSNSVLFAILTNSVGGLVGSNQVIYPNAFEGATASIRYKYTRAGFEQDILVEGQLPDLASLGLNRARTKLGVLTAFFGTNTPVVTPGLVDAANSLSDSTLMFGNGSGSLRMGAGRAFSIGDSEPTSPPVGATAASWLNWLTNAANHASPGGAPTFKRWINPGTGRTRFLMEEIPYPRVAAQLNKLPPMTGRLEGASTNLFAANSILDAIPPRLLSQPAASATPGETRTMRLSRADSTQTPALVMDYVTLNGAGTDIFQGDTTYLISGPVYLNNAILEGGTVIKYGSADSVPITQIGAWDATLFIEVDGALTCHTSSYHPAVFTSADDNTVGEVIAGSTGNPTTHYYANPAIYAPGGANLSNLRVSYAIAAVLVGESDYSSLTLSDSQIYGCGMLAILGLNDGYDYSINLTCNNCLYSWGSFGVLDYGNGYDTYNFNNCTIQELYCLSYAPNPGYTQGNAVNCIFATVGYWGNIPWQGDPNGFYQTDPTFIGSYPISTVTWPFLTVGGGNFYLADNSPFREQGTTAGLSSDLLADLQTKTTYPPSTSYVNNPISASTLSPRGLANTGTPDLGYHYPVMDYILADSTLNANLTVDPDTVIGWQKGPQGQAGLSFSDWGYVLSFNGTAANPCYFVRCNTVQEADNSGDGVGIAGSAQEPEIKSTFTRFSAVGDLAAFFDGNWVYADALYNTEFWSGSIGGDAIDVLELECYNCLFDRSEISFSMAAAGNYGGLQLQDCTLHGGGLTFTRPNNTRQMNASIYDSAFDSTTITVNSYAVSAVSAAYNAYLSGANYLPGASSANGDVFVTSTFNWQSGPLGTFYLPPQSPTGNDGRLLINAGDQQASQINIIVDGATSDTAPLSSFTTQTGQQLDSGLVDIGYHYAFWRPPPPPLGPMDVAFIIDDTFSMANSIQAIKTAADGALDYIVSASGNNYRLALVTPDSDQVNVRVNFATNNRDTFENALAVVVSDSFDNEYGNNVPESTDKCVETVARSLSANQAVNDYGCTRPSTDPTTLQVGSISYSSNNNARKIIVLITDAPPSGFCDSSATPYDTWYEGKAHYIASQYAATQQIRINAILLQGGPFETGARTVLQDYAQTTSGWYPPELNYSSSSLAVENDILYMLYN